MTKRIGLRAKRVVSAFTIGFFLFSMIPAQNLFAANEGASPVGMDPATQQPMVSATAPVETPTPKNEVPSGMQFQMDSPLSSPTSDNQDTKDKVGKNKKEEISLKKEPLDQTNSAQTKLIQNDLVKTFGFTEDQVADLIKKGLITFKSKPDISPVVVWSIGRVFGNNAMTVYIDPSIKMPAGTVNLTDPLGNNNLPTQIDYKFNFVNTMCMEGTSCPAGFQISQANFTNSKGQTVEVGYHGNQADSVKVYETDKNAICIQSPCNVRKLVKEISFGRTKDGSLAAKINYYDDSEGDVKSRVVSFDKENRIKEVAEFDKEGKLIATNIFQRVEQRCVQAPCPSSITMIDRVDASGKLLSNMSISVIKDGVSLITITLPSGEVVSEKRKGLSLEEAFDFARTVEVKHEEVHVQPFTISVSTNQSNDNLFVSVDENGKAIVTWSDGRQFHKTTYEGVFEQDKSNGLGIIRIKMPNGDAEESLELLFSTTNDFQKSYILSSFQYIKSSSKENRLYLYQYNANGLMIKQKTHEAMPQWSDGKYVDGVYDGESSMNYIMVNGNWVMDSETRQVEDYPFFGGRLIQNAKTFYRYDDHGEYLASITVTAENYDGNQVTYVNYYSKDLATLTQTSLYAQESGMTETELWQKSNSFENALTAGAASENAIKDVDYYNDADFSPEHLKFTIEYVAVNKSLIVKRVNMPDGNTFIVQGDPDVLNLEHFAPDSKDILMRPGREVNGYDIYYGSSFISTNNIQSVFSDYGLVFSKWEQDENGQWKQILGSVVDYPKENTVKLNDIYGVTHTYKIEIDEEGKVSLHEVKLIQPFSISVSTDLSNEPNLNISVQKDSTAVIEYNHQTYEGELKNGTIVAKAPFDSGSDLILMFDQTAYGTYQLKSFEEKLSGYVEGGTTYYFDNTNRVISITSNLIFQDGENFNISMNTYSYLWINNVAVTSAMTYEYIEKDADGIKSRSVNKQFIQYGKDGDQIGLMQVTFFESRENGQFASAIYNLVNFEDLSITYAYLYGVDLVNEVNRLEDYKVIDDHLDVKNVTFFTDSTFNEVKYYGEFGRNPVGGEFLLRKIKMPDGHVYAMPGHTLIKEYQYATIGDSFYSVSFGPAYDYSSSQPYKGYGLVFEGGANDSEGVWKSELVVVDPTATEVTLSGKTYKIKIDKEGNVNLQEGEQVAPIVPETLIPKEGTVEQIAPAELNTVVPSQLTLKDADANGDGTVDAADYTALRKKNASQEYLDNWKKHFGEKVEDVVVEINLDTKKETHYKNGEMTFTIESFKTTDGTFMPKKVTMADGRIFAVQGDPDVLNLEHFAPDPADILIKEGPIESSWVSSPCDGCTVWLASARYGLGQSSFDLTGADHYGLNIALWWIVNDGVDTMAGQATYIGDYPNVKTFDFLDGTYKIEIDQEGNVSLQEAVTTTASNKSVINEEIPGGDTLPVTPNEPEQPINQAGTTEQIAPIVPETLYPEAPIVPETLYPDGTAEQVAPIVPETLYPTAGTVEEIAPVETSMVVPPHLTIGDADANGDMIIDARDYVALKKKNGSSMWTLQEYLDNWRKHFGETVGDAGAGSGLSMDQETVSTMPTVEGNQITEKENGVVLNSIKEETVSMPVVEDSGFTVKEGVVLNSSVKTSPKDEMTARKRRAQEEGSAVVGRIKRENEMRKTQDKKKKEHPADDVLSVS